MTATTAIFSKQILRFWFGSYDEAEEIPTTIKKWFKVDQAFDREVHRKFGPILQELVDGRAPYAAETPSDRLALVILQDQFPRNAFRGTSRAFAFDASALQLASEMVDRQEDSSLLPFHRSFLYLPFTHSEQLEIQNRSVSLSQRLAREVPQELIEYFQDSFRYAERHREIIQHYGRFPHRNAILGRPSTPQELAFLKEPLSSF